MFAKKQAVSALNKTRDVYNAQLQKGTENGLDEPAQAVWVSFSLNYKCTQNLSGKMSGVEVPRRMKRCT